MVVISGTKPRRVVTINRTSKSAVLIDDELEMLPGFASNATTIWKTHQYPAELADSDAKDDNLQIYTRGSLIRVVDFPANSQGHNHRTKSLDYGIILSGELELLLEDGSRTVLRSGDIVVQQATMHQWNNMTENAARVIFILYPSQASVVDGKELGDTGIPNRYLPNTEVTPVVK